MAAIWLSRDHELFVEGPAGTGKTRTILEKLWWLANAYPGVRILLTRLDAERVRRSVLVTLERDVIPRGHPCLNGPMREYRNFYNVGNGSKFIIDSAADIQRILSQEYDFVYWNEITELPFHEPYEALHRALRSGPGPYRQIITDANPNRPNHWILKRAKRGLTRRLFTKLEDNPAYHDGTTWTPAGLEYRERLAHNLTGVQRKRLFEGVWCSADGRVVPQFDEERNMIPLPPMVEGRGGRAEYDWTKVRIPALGITTSIRWWTMGIDFGTTAPGVLQVWGVDGEKRMIRVAEIYRTGMLGDWWAERVVELVKEFHRPGRPFRAAWADPEDRDARETMNKRLVDAGLSAIIRPANNDVESTYGLVRDGLNPERPRIFMCVGATRYGRERELDDRGRPCSTEEELLELVYSDRIEKPHREKDERPDPLCPDHGTDAMRYAVDGTWRRDLSADPDKPDAPTFEANTWGHRLGHEELWKRRLRRREEW